MIDYKRVHELRIDEGIWIIFIILSIINIFGDEYEKDYCIHHIYQEKVISKNIFTFTVFISLCIYLFLEYQRYEKFKSSRLQKQSTLIPGIRCFGGGLVVIATVLFLYCQIIDNDSMNPFVL